MVFADGAGTIDRVGGKQWLNQFDPVRIGQEY
jgi:hypothetical protein